MSPLQPSRGQKGIKEPLIHNFMLVLAAVEFSTVDLGGFGEPWWRAGHHAFTWWSESKKIIHSLKKHHRPRHTHLAELPMGWRRGAISSHKGHKPGRSEEPDAWASPPFGEGTPGCSSRSTGASRNPTGSASPSSPVLPQAYRWSLPCPSAKNHLFQSHPPTGSSQAEVEGRGFLPCPLSALHGTSSGGTRQAFPPRPQLPREPPRSCSSWPLLTTTTPPHPDPFVQRLPAMVHLWVTASPSIRLSDLPKTFLTKSLHQRAPSWLHGP